MILDDALVWFLVIVAACFVVAVGVSVYGALAVLFGEAQVIVSIDYLTLVIAGGVMIALAEPDVPGNRGALAVFMVGVFVFVIGTLSALRSALGL